MKSAETLVAWLLTPHIAAAGSYTTEHLLQSISEVMLTENSMSYYLWVLIFPIVWATLSDNKEKQIHLAKPIISLLSKEFHQEQAAQRPNVVQVATHLSFSEFGLRVTASPHGG